MLSRSVESPKKQRGATLIGSPLAHTNPADLPCRPSQNYEVLGICNDKHRTFASIASGATQWAKRITAERRSHHLVGDTFNLARRTTLDERHYLIG